MVKASSYVKKGLKKGAWTEEEDNKLRAYIQRYGHWNWGLLPKFAGVSRSGKSCRLRWMNYLRPNMKHGNFTEEEDTIIIDSHNKIGNKWSTIAAKLPGRSDNEVKNRWNTHLKKRVQEDQTVSGSETIESLQDGDPAVKGMDLEHQQEPDMFTPQTFVDEMVGDLWTDQFFQDNDDSIIPSGENLLSPLNFVDDYIYQSSCQEMIMNDEFLWSALDTYVEDNMWNS